MKPGKKKTTLTKKKLKPLTREEKSDLWSSVDNEGFWYYMSNYGPDVELIERMGYDWKKINEALKLLEDLESAIVEFEADFFEEREDGYEG